MVNLLKFVGAVLASILKSPARREAEILFLRQQVLVLRRLAPGRARLGLADKLIFVWLYRLFSTVSDAALIFKPETLVRWHRRGFRLFWRWKSRRPAGRPTLPVDVRKLVLQMSRENPPGGAPRIHGELLKLGIEIGQSSVAKYMARSRRPPSQSWRTFFRNHAPDIAAMDLFVVPTIGFKLLYGLAILRLGRRQLVWTNVTTNPTAEWIARQVTEAFPWDQAPRYLVRDRDGAFGAVITRRLQAMGIRDRPTADRSPWQNGHTERLIGSIRRECLDHMVIFGEGHLRRTLRAYADYYNRARTRPALAKDTPLGRPVQAVGCIMSVPLLGGLHHQYVRTA
jgi:transposase InsO family protein